MLQAIVQSPEALSNFLNLFRAAFQNRPQPKASSSEPDYSVAIVTSISASVVGYGRPSKPARRFSLRR